MGRAKQEQIEYDAKVQQAVFLCLTIGAIEECEIHSGSYIDNMEFSDCAELLERIIAEDAEALTHFEDKDEMSHCVKDALALAGDECGYCANNRES